MDSDCPSRTAETPIEAGSPAAPVYCRISDRKGNVKWQNGPLGPSKVVSFVLMCGRTYTKLGVVSLGAAGILPPGNGFVPNTLNDGESAQALLALHILMSRMGRTYRAQGAPLRRYHIPRSAWRHSWPAQQRVRRGSRPRHEGSHCQLRGCAQRACGAVTRLQAGHLQVKRLR